MTSAMLRVSRIAAQKERYTDSGSGPVNRSSRGPRPLHPANPAGSLGDVGGAHAGLQNRRPKAYWWPRTGCGTYGSSSRLIS